MSTDAEVNLADVIAETDLKSENERLKRRIQELELQQARPSKTVVHQSIRNYLVNELGFSRDAIIELIKPMVSNCFDRLLGSEYTPAGWMPASQWLRNMVAAVVEARVKTVVQEYVQQVMKERTRVTVEVITPKAGSLLDTTQAK